MFFNKDSQKYITMERDNEDLLIKNNELKSKIKILEKLVNKSRDYITDDIFLGKLLYTKKNNTKIYASSCRQLFPNLTPWDFNRPIDDKHKQHLKNIILKTNNIEGYFDILKCNDKLCIVNGQHRYFAILDIMKENSMFDIEIFCNVHQVDDFDGEMATDIFLSTNNTKNVELKYNPDKKLQNTCSRLEKHFPGCITSNKSGRANMHRIDKKEIYNTMQMNEVFISEKYDEKQLFDKIVEKNNELSCKPYSEFFGKSKTEKNRKLWENAIKSGFYIGLKKGPRLGWLFMEIK